MKIGTQDLGSINIIFWRVAIGASCLLPFVILLGRWKRLPLHTWMILALAGILNSAIPFTLLAQATVWLQSGFVSILNANTLIFTALLATIWLKEPFTRLQMFGAFISVLGLVILFYDSLSDITMRQQNSLALLMCLASGVCYAIAITISRKYLHTVPPLMSACVSMFCATLFLFIIGWSHIYIPKWQWTAWQAPLILGVLCTAAAFWLYFRLMKHIGSAKVASVTLVIPLFGVIWGVMLLNEMVSLNLFIGGVLIILGAALIHRVDTWLLNPKS